MSEAARKAQAEYMRKYRKQNPDRIREINRRYWEKRAKKQQEAKESNAENADSAK